MKSPTTSARRATSAEGAGCVFYGAITPHDPETGELVLTADKFADAIKPARAGLMFFDFPEAPVLAQTWVIYRHLSRMLQERGLSLHNVVRQRLFIRDVRELPAIERIMDLVLGDSRPATSIVVMAAGGIHPDLHLQLDAVAALDVAGRIVIKDDLLRRYPAAVRCGDFVFTSVFAALRVQTLGNMQTMAICACSRRRVSARYMRKACARLPISSGCSHSPARS